MGRLVDGNWVTEQQWSAADGRFKRAEAVFRNWVTVDGSPGPSGTGGFKAEPGRYHLYVALACPWAHRTLIFRKLKKLEQMVSVSVVDPLMDEHGWKFTAEQPDHLLGFERLHQVYRRADPNASSRVTVPVLWDRQTDAIVSNESSEIIRMFNSAFDGVGADASVDFYPSALREEIDALNTIVYKTVNNGVYKAGFAGTQAVYEEVVTALFASLDMLEDRLSASRYLMGHRITEADWRLFTTLLRF
ncbi:MAG: glutathione S-transferase family protein, partial [Alphaproteobacteria bacterium]